MKSKKSLLVVFGAFLLCVFLMIPICADAEEALETKKTGWQYEGENYYYYADGEKCTGWLKSGAYWYYLDPEQNGIMLSDSVDNIDGKTYGFDINGRMLTGWQKINDQWYYFKSSGAGQEGWLKSGAYWYYLDPKQNGIMLSDSIYNIDGKTYGFDINGRMLTGWQKINGQWYYFQSSGAGKEGWLKSGSFWYYLDPNQNGVMLSDTFAEINGRTYALDSNGRMLTGWKMIEDWWYYFQSSGEKAEGWILSGRYWYYLDPDQNGRMVHDEILVIDGNKFLFDNNGRRFVGWYNDGVGWQYYNSVGGRSVGWKKVNGLWYYLDPEDNDYMKHDCWLELNGVRYYLSGNGAMKTGWLLYEGEWYHFSDNGEMQTGWIPLGESWFYLYEDDDEHPMGSMAKDTIIDGWVIAPNGVYNNAVQLAAEVIKRLGSDLSDCFDWSAEMPYTALSIDDSTSSRWYAEYGFENYTGNCYVMAATFYYMGLLLGYDIHQISGYVPCLYGGLTPHSWCEVDIDGVTYVCDPDFTNETERNGYMIYYGQSGTWRYEDYYRMN